ncbi:MAG: hypothetical protein LBT59_08265 [Clostridiales bacterium]|nr:hypothetical protein [Clostridiales bacterium]
MTSIYDDDGWNKKDKLDLYNFELFHPVEDLGKALKLYQDNQVSITMLDRDSRCKGSVLDERSWSVRISFDPQGHLIPEAGNAYNAHELAVLFAIRGAYLGAQASLRPPKMFGAKTTSAFKNATYEYIHYKEKTAIELAKDLVPANELVELSLALSIILKITVSRTRILEIADIEPETGIMAISVFGEEALQNDKVLLAAKLQALALDALDSTQNLAWRGKGRAMIGKAAVFSNLEKVVNAVSDQETGSKILDVLINTLNQAKHPDTILSLANLSMALCKDDMSWSLLKKALTKARIHLPSDKVMDARVMAEIQGDREAFGAMLKKRFHESAYFKVGYIDYLIGQESYREALRACDEEEEDREYRYIQFPEIQWRWYERRCIIFDRLGDKEKVRGLREAMAFDFPETADTPEDYLRNCAELKKLCPKEDWDIIAERLGARISDPKIYAEFLWQEGKIQELCDLCDKNLDMILRFYERLALEHKQKADELAEAYIWEQAEPADNTDDFARVCKRLLELSDLGANAKSLRIMLSQQYPERTAFINMLNELKLG